MSVSMDAPDLTSSASLEGEADAERTTSRFDITNATTRFEADDEIELLSRPQESLSVLDVASYILKKKGTMSTMKLQKLVYYCQAWSLVWDEEPLYREPIEAWANGPVVRRLFDHHRGQYSISRILTGNPGLLSREQRETVDAVLEFYGKMTAQELIDRSHAEPPWENARKGLEPFERGQSQITLDSIHEYFSALAAQQGA